MNKITENELTEIKNLLEANHIGNAIDKLNEMIRLFPKNDELLYMRGNAKRKNGEWSEAINDYLAAVAVNPESPAQQAAEMLGDILEFRNKDLYNQ